MSKIIGYRPNDGGETARRIDALIERSRIRFNKSDVLRAAMDEYLSKMEKAQEYTIPLHAVPIPQKSKKTQPPTVGVDEAAEQQPIFPSLSPEMNKKLNGFIAIGRKARLAREAAASKEHRKQA